MRGGGEGEGDGFCGGGNGCGGDGGPDGGAGDGGGCAGTGGSNGGVNGEGGGSRGELGSCGGICGGICGGVCGGEDVTGRTFEFTYAMTTRTLVPRIGMRMHSRLVRVREGLVVASSRDAVPDETRE